MWIHFFLLGLILMVSLIFFPKNRGKNGAYLFVVFTILFVFSTFRAYDVGNDTSEYYRVFQLINGQQSLKLAMAASRYEVGYVFLCFLVEKITANYTILLGVVSAVYLGSVLRFINKYSTNVRLSCVLFFSFSLFYDVMNLQRQCIALAIFLFAIDYLIQRKPIKYFALILLASLFQSTGIILAFIYFLPKADFNRTKSVLKWMGIVLAAFAGINVFVRVFTSLFPYYSHYFNSMYSEGGVRSASIAFFAIRFLVVGLLVILGGIKKYVREFDNEKNVFLILTLIDLMCAFVSIGFNLFDRIENFFTLGLIILVSNTVEKLHHRNRFPATVIVVMVPLIYLTISLALRQNWYGIFPYRFI